MTVVEISQALEAEEALAATLEAYAGQWVAVRDYKVVHHAGTLRELLELVSGEYVERILEVSDDPAASCFF